MEDVWKDISLASLYDHPTTTHGGPAAFRGISCQDFLANKLLVDPPEPPPTQGVTRASAGDHTTGTTPSLPPPPPPPTFLSLNSGTPSDFQHLQTTSTTSAAAPIIVMKPKPQLVLQTSDDAVSTRPSFVSSRSSEALASSSVFPCFNKRGLRLPPQINDNCSSRRHKRMMMNRESASRSRARKQEFIDLSTLSTNFIDSGSLSIHAYTNELELELAHLREENTRLKRQLAKFYLKGASAQLPKSHTLYRTSTAPF